MFVFGYVVNFYVKYTFDSEPLADYHSIYSTFLSSVEKVGANYIHIYIQFSIRDSQFSLINIFIRFILLIIALNRVCKQIISEGNFFSVPLHVLISSKHEQNCYYTFLLLLPPLTSERQYY